MKTLIATNDIDLTDAIMESPLAPDVAAFLRRLVDDGGVRLVRTVKLYADTSSDSDCISVSLE